MSVQARRQVHWIVVAVLMTCGLGVTGCSSSSGSPNAVVLINGTAATTSFHSGENVKVTLGANKKFAPNSTVNIIMCSDPGGKQSNLPTSFDVDCDEDTIQGNTILANSSGGFSDRSYTIYRLPNAALGESKTLLPVCDATHYCVLYLSQNQTDINSPKFFSSPFVVTGGTKDNL